MNTKIPNKLRIREGRSCFLCELFVAFVLFVAKNAAIMSVIRCIICGEYALYLLHDGGVANGWRYVFVANFGARHCQTDTKFEASYNP